jgi:hypothetical protein
MDAEQRSLYQTVPEASLGYERYVSASNRHPWWAWMVVLVACLGILFVIAILFSAAFHETFKGEVIVAHDLDRF